ncbi:MAG: 4-(cytidine 5'-diphospho)-2-C-methyl-D-erythritol kinase [Parachlamydiales bacterium]|nr:4-(cytidine 5'-diphospho)-2-C-methyl-D-erythritol kinase [Parachlamydiales bacterium]
MFLTFFSPAKVNLFFKILKKREDGYHEIASLYQAVSIYDLLSFRKSKKKDNFVCSDKNLLWENNLIQKAYFLFKEKANIDENVEILLKKNIPMQAGLGGGSSNAATTLFALNELFSKPLKETQLIELAKKIGSDVAFFFSSGSAYCEGVGSDFTNVKLRQDLNFYILKPNFGMSTKLVYENVDLNNLLKLDLKLALSDFEKGKTILFNDLEDSAFRLDNRLKKIKEDYQKIFGLENVSMSGSGSSFIVFSSAPIKKVREIQTFKVFNVQRKDGNWYSL